MFNPDTYKRNFEPQWKKSLELQRQEAELKKIATKNIQKSAQLEKKSRPDLVDNFHWVIMRFRRNKKLTQEQFAKEISEPVESIIRAESGILPEKDYVLVRKIENALGISLVKKELEKKVLLSKQEEAPVPKVLKLEPTKIRELTIADLRRIKEKKDSGIIGDDFEEDEEDIQEKTSEAYSEEKSNS